MKASSIRLRRHPFESSWISILSHKPLFSAAIGGDAHLGLCIYTAPQLRSDHWFRVSLVSEGGVERLGGAVACRSLPLKADFSEALKDDRGGSGYNTVNIQHCNEVSEHSLHVTNFAG